MKLRYGSVCSGIEAASVAWDGMGMEPAFFAEIAKFPSKVLAHHYPHVPNLGDFTKIGTTADEATARAVDVLVGGTPCQSFSVAGERAGLDDARGHLAVEFLLLARRLGARWVLWENVPGVLSVDDGDAFGTFLTLMADLGYGVAWRVLDAQFCGVAQRRRRVFVVGHFGDWRPAAAVLLERPSMQGHPAARRGAGADVAAGAQVGAGVLGEAAGAGRITNALTAHGFRQDPSLEPYVVDTLHGHHYRNDPSGPYVPEQDQVGTLLSNAGRSANNPGLIVAPTLLKSGGRLGSYDTPVVTDAVDTLRACARKSTSSVGPLVVSPIQDATRSRVRKQHGIGIGKPTDPAFTLTRNGGHAVAFHTTQDPISSSTHSPVLGCEPGSIGVLSWDEQQITHAENRSRPRPGQPAPTLSKQGRINVSSAHARPRRLTPREWERLQGFPDDHTNIAGAKDSHRYEALGNSMAVPVMKWIGRRMLMVEQLLNTLKVA